MTKREQRMRDIRFRAWHKEMKLMYRVLSLVLGQREQEASLVRYRTTLVRYEGPSVTCHLDEIELMQYTGVKDKNGTKIYEGDICTVEDWRMVGGRYQVYWNDDRWGLQNGEGENYDNGDYYRGDEIEWNECEIIGNIYENPELL